MIYLAFRWWKGGFPKFPFTNNHEANLDYFLSVFSEIWEEWEEMYNELKTWKENTDLSLEEWKNGVIDSIANWELEFQRVINEWKTETETDISEWENDVIEDIEAWKQDFIDDYENIESRVESIVSDTEDMIENLAPPFSSSDNYSIDDYAVYNGNLYRFINNHSGAWNASDVVRSTATSDIKYNKYLSLRHLTSGEVSEISDFVTMPKGVYFSMKGGEISSIDSYFSDKLVSGTTYIVLSYRYGDVLNTGIVEIFGASWEKHFTGYVIANSTSVRWYNLNYSEQIAEVSQDVDTLEENTNTNIEYILDHALTRLNIEEISNLTSLANMKKGVYFTANRDRILELEPNFPFELRNVSYMIICWRYSDNSEKGGIIEIFNGSMRHHYVGYITAAGTAITWYNVNEKNELYVLSFGSSFEYSTLGYFPAIFNEISPNTHLIFGLCYISGGGIQDHLTYWNNNTKYSVYSEYDSDKKTFTNYSNTYTGKQAFARQKWDFILIHEKVANNTDFTTISNFIDTLSLYSTFPLSFVYNMVQANGKNGTFDSSYTGTGKENSDEMYSRMATYAQTILNTSPQISDVIPCGTAVQNARTTSLSSLGVYGDLCIDSASHLQNGIPCMIPAYCAAYKLLELSNSKSKIFSVPLSPTDSWLDTYNLQTKTSHGSCVGVTDNNKLLAQKCALMAIKKPFEITDLS